MGSESERRPHSTSLRSATFPINILKQSGCEITSDGEIIATGRRNTKRVVVYPAMWVEPQATGTIFVSDAYIKYAKPYAVQKILDSIQ